MKKVYWLVLAGMVAMTGCGKAGVSEETKIVSDCSLNGRGEYKCTFKNKGTAKSSLCEHVVLQANLGYKRLFGIFSDFGSNSYRDTIKSSKNSLKGVFEYVIQNKGKLEGPSAEDKDRDEKSMLRSEDHESLERRWAEKNKLAMKNSGERLDEFITHYRAVLAVETFEIDKKGLSQTEVCSGIVEAGDVKEVNGLALFGSEGLSPVDACFNPYGDRKWSDACSFTTISVTEIDKIVKAKLESTSTK